MKRSTCAAALGGLLLSFGCDQGTTGSDPVAGEAKAPHSSARPAPAEPMAVEKVAAGPMWESLAGPLGDTRDEAMAAAETRLEAVGERVAELMPAPGEAPARAQHWVEIQERVDRVQRDVVRLGVATETEWHSVKTDLEESFSAIDAMLREVREEAPVG